MTFNIGSQHAGVINNVAGDQHNQVITLADAHDVLRQLRRAVEQAGLPPETSRRALDQLDLAATEMAKPKPQKPVVADRLSRLTQLLQSAGALASAGTALARPLAAMAGWSGVIGEPIMRSLQL